MTARRICVVTGSRADYGLLKYLCGMLRTDSRVDLQVVVTGMHLEGRFGNTVEQIEKDGFQIADRIAMELDSDTPQGLARSMGLALAGFGRSLQRLQPDLIVLLGDRFEIFCAAQAAMLARIPIGHIHGGERTEGAIDEAIRHAITKMSHLHFAATEAYARRIRQLGEKPDHVFVVGAPGLDQLGRLAWLDKCELADDLGIALREKLFLVTYHSVTLDDERQIGIDELLGALDAYAEATILFTFPNADTFGRQLIEKIQAFCSKDPSQRRLFESLGQQRYLSAMALASAVIGNSSSGIIEAPALGVPTVNIGKRQDGRIRSDSIIDCEEDREAIRAAIERAISPDFRRNVAKKVSAYGGPGASERIANIVAEIPLKDLLNKQFVDL